MATNIILSRQQCSCHARQSSREMGICPSCVQYALQNLKQLHEAAIEKRNMAREHFAEKLPELSRGQRLSELRCESEQMREKLSKLRQECSSLAVKLASQVVDNDERHMRLSIGSYTREQMLKRLEQALYHPDGGAMTRAISVATDTVKRLRFHWALQVFSMFRLDVEKIEKRPTERHLHARGIGKIGGLPLPHAGQELYGVLPPLELQSALRLVAGLTCTLSKCLGISLPHPVLLQPHMEQRDIVDRASIFEDQVLEAHVATKRKDTTSSTTTSESIMALMDTTIWGRSAKTALQMATGSKPAPIFEDQAIIPPSMDSSAVSQRLLHATAAVLAEDGSATCARFALIPSSGEHFAIGLQLLQNNVIALCIRVGVPVDVLWPGGAMLLNLHALMIYSAQQVLQCDDDEE